MSDGRDKECTHPGIPVVTFDRAQAQYLEEVMRQELKHKTDEELGVPADLVGERRHYYRSDIIHSMVVSETRKRWPRGYCKLCGTIIYASREHYYFGDW